MAEGDTFDPQASLEAPAPVEPAAPSPVYGIDGPPPDVEEPDDAEGGDDEEVLETIEVEIGGKKYIVPKDVEPHLLREEDYTQKTQTLAEQRKEVEAFQQQLHEKAQIQEAVLDDIAQVRNMDTQLQEYDKIDWPAYQLQDPNAAGYHWMQFQQLKGYREQAAQAVNQKMQYVSQLQSQNREATIQKTITALSKPDPEYGWPGYSPAYLDRLSEAARVHLGMTDKELSSVLSPKGIKIINAAVITAQNFKKAAASSVAPAVEARPVRQVPSARGRPHSSASGDDKSVDKWVKDERARVAKLAANGSYRI